MKEFLFRFSAIYYLTDVERQYIDSLTSIYNKFQFDDNKNIIFQNASFLIYPPNEVFNFDNTINFDRLKCTKHFERRLKNALTPTLLGDKDSIEAHKEIIRLNFSHYKFHFLDICICSTGRIRHANTYLYKDMDMGYKYIHNPNIKGLFTIILTRLLVSQSLDELNNEYDMRMQNFDKNMKKHNMSTEEFQYRLMIYWINYCYRDRFHLLILTRLLASQSLDELNCVYKKEMQIFDRNMKRYNIEESEYRFMIDIINRCYNDKYCSFTKNLHSFFFPK